MQTDEEICWPHVRAWGILDEKFYEEVTDYMKNYFFITEDNDTFKLMPTINHYQGKIVAEEEKNNQLNLFEGDYNV